MATRNPSRIEIIDQETASVELTQGKWAIIDVADIPLVGKYKWCAVLFKRQNTYYALTSIREIPSDDAKLTMMHRFLMGAKDSEQHVDHDNGDTLNNRRSNLRFATRTQNLRNSQKRKNASSQWKGVFFSNKDKRWLAKIRVDKKQIVLGYFKSEIEAATAYYNKAMEVDPVYYGRLPFPT